MRFGLGVPAMGPLAGFNAGFGVPPQGRTFLKPGERLQEIDPEELERRMQEVRAMQSIRPESVPQQVRAPRDRGMFGRFLGLLANKPYGAEEMGLWDRLSAGREGVNERRSEVRQERRTAQTERAQAERQAQINAMLAGMQEDPRIAQLIQAGVPGASEMAVKQMMTPPVVPEPYIINNQIVDPETLQVRGDYRDEPEPGERWEQIPAPPGIPGFFERSTKTGQTRRVAGPPSGGIVIGPDGSVTIGGPLGFGNAPVGKDPAIVFDEYGQPVVTPGPQQIMYNKARRAVDEFVAQNSIVLGDIDRALELISPWSTGAGAALKNLPVIGGVTPAGQMDSLIETIRANVGFDKLHSMRETSGGALGQVTERELAFLQSVFGSLRTDLSPQNVRRNLERLREHMVGREERLRAALAQDFPDLDTTIRRREGVANRDWSSATDADLMNILTGGR